MPPSRLNNSARLHRTTSAFILPCSSHHNGSIEVRFNVVGTTVTAIWTKTSTVAIVCRSSVSILLSNADFRMWSQDFVPVIQNRIIKLHIKKICFNLKQIYKNYTLVG